MEGTVQNSGLKNKWVITAILLAGQIGILLLQYGCSAYLTLISEDLGLNGAQQGTFSGIQSMASIVTMLFAAVLSVKIGIKKSYAIGSVLTMLSGLCFLTGSYSMLLAARVVLGLAAGVTTPLRAAIISYSFGDDKRAAMIATGVVGSGSFIGRFFGLAVTFPLLSLVGSWKTAMLCFGVIGVIVAVLWLLTYPSAEEFQGMSKQAEGAKAIILSMKDAIKISTVRKFAIYFSFSGISGNVFNAFLPAFLVYAKSLEAGQASSVASYSGIAGLAGSILGGVIASRISTKAVIIPSEIISFIIMIVVAVIPDPSIPVLIALVMIHGFCNAAQSVNNLGLMYKTPGITPVQATSAMSFIMACFYLFGYASLQIFGMVYPVIGMQKAMMIWAVPVLIGVIVASTIKEEKFKN